ncbi:MAG: sigma 54-interacting transcriptional regulator [Firmicutes bacterium]|nr:sigma 54-interacting transcriptional regulator [Bacillota bacterium]
MGDLPVDLEHLSADLRIILDSIDEGVHIVDTAGITVFYNRVAGQLDNLDCREVVGRHILSVFPSLSEDTSTLLSVLRTGRAAPIRQQTFRTFKGDTITTLNSTLPIYSGAKLVGAIEISKDLTLLRALAEKVVDLQAELYSGRKVPAAVPRAAKFTFTDIVAESTVMKELVRTAEKAARSSSSVLVYGETGAGKELIVQSIHNASPRASGPFIAQNCAALPETLLEGILFGSVKGAFTGAENRPGLFEVAHGGTIFLDEIDSMPLPLQAKLLRVLQEGTVRRIGDSSERRTDVRVISAMSANPQEAAERGLIRRDLLFRLSVIVLEVPPLRKRPEDIPALTDFFVRRYSAQFGVDVRGVTPDVMDLFMRRPWHGNVRELQHAVEAAVQMSQGHYIAREHLPPHISDESRAAGSRTSDVPKAEAPPTGRQQAYLVPALRRLEEDMIRSALEICGGNVSATARHLGIPRQTLQHKLKRLGIQLDA